jgi:hypothetical protein
MFLFFILYIRLIFLYTIVDQTLLIRKVSSSNKLNNNNNNTNNKPLLYKRGDVPYYIFNPKLFKCATASRYSLSNAHSAFIN